MNKNMKRALLLLISGIYAINVAANTPIVEADLSVPSRVAPAFFGPNAFPVPDMLDGRTLSDLKMGLYIDNFFGVMAKRTVTDDFAADMFLRLTVPLFTPRVNLTLWMPVCEYFSSGPEVNEYRRIDHEGRLTGWFPGDVYVTTDIMFLIQERHHIDATIRAALKSASGHGWHYARNYDSPGYFFDASFGRSFRVGSRTSFRAALSGGFLCWQTDNGRQNDAVMYGVHASLTSGRLHVETEYGGYVGWEQYGDAPMTLKSALSWDIGNFSVRLMHQVGFIDWPFHQVRAGIEYRIPLCKQL